MVMVNVEGDSMFPTFSSGNVVAVLNAKDQQKTERPWVVRINAGVDALTLLKRIQFSPGDILRLKSDNPAYQPFERDMKEEQLDFQLIGRVVWAPRHFGGER